MVRRGPLGLCCALDHTIILWRNICTINPCFNYGMVVFKPAKHGVLLISPLLEAFRTAD
jgi:glyceraldehyde-3-phosphate dehydrogenase (NADP+)